MAGKKRLIVGLGNPTPQYEGTRHNVGFAVLDRLVGKDSFRNDGRAQAWVREKSLRGRPVVLVKPQTYMNRSGFSVKSLMRRYLLTPQDIVVVVDDLNLPLGSIRIRAKGGAGGHNGMLDIIDSIGTNSFPRVRIGIGSEFERGRQSRYVLTRFSEKELPVVAGALKNATLAVATFVTDGVVMAMNRHNRRSVEETVSTSPT